MLSLFPQLLFLSPFAAFLIRLALACVFAYSAYHRIPHGTTLLKVFGVIDALIAIALLIGFSTQLAALVGFICSVAWLAKPEWNPYPKSTTALVAVMCLIYLCSTQSQGFLDRQLNLGLL